jgi:hypothetical protein
LEIFRYAVEVYLRWTPEQVRDHLSWDTIYRMKLEPFMKYIRFPAETDETKDLFVIAHKLYPNRIRLDAREMTLIVYKRILSGELYKFPKGFFNGNKGLNRALICFQYMLIDYSGFQSIEDMYSYFACSKGTKLLKDYKLNAISTSMFRYNIDYLHEALPSSMKNEYFYKFYRFKITNNEQIRKLKKAGEFIA